MSLRHNLINRPGQAAKYLEARAGLVTQPAVDESDRQIARLKNLYVMFFLSVPLPC